MTSRPVSAHLAKNNPSCLGTRLKAILRFRTSRWHASHRTWAAVSSEKTTSVKAISAAAVGLATSAGTVACQTAQGCPGEANHRYESIGRGQMV